MGGSKAVESERADDGSNDAGDRDGVVEVEPPQPQQKKKPTSPPPASPPNGDASAANPKKNSKDVGDAGVPPPPGTSAQDDSTSEAVKSKDAAAAAADAASPPCEDTAATKSVDGGVLVKKEGTSSTTAKDKEDVNVASSKAEESPKEVKCQACLEPTHGQRFRVIPCDHVICASCFGKMHALSTACCPVGSCGRDATGHIVEEVTSEADTGVVAVKKLPPQMYEKRPLQPLRRDVDAVVTVTSRAAASSGGGAGGPSAASPSGTTTPGKFQTKTFALSRGSKDDELVALCALLHPYVIKGNSLANAAVPPGGRPNLIDRCIAALAGLDRTQQRQQPPMPVPVLPPLAFAHPKGYPPPAALYPPMPHPAMAMHPGVMPMPPLQPPHPPPPHQQQPPGARMGVPPTTAASTAATQPGRGRAEGGGKRTLEASRKERKNAQARSRAAKTREVMDDLRRRPREELTPEEAKVLDAFEERRRKKNDRSKEREAERKAEIERIRAIPERRRTAEERETLDTFMRVKLRKNEGDRLRRARIKSEVEGGGRNHVPV